MSDVWTITTKECWECSSPRTLRTRHYTGTEVRQVIWDGCECGSRQIVFFEGMDPGYPDPSPHQAAE